MSGPGPLFALLAAGLVFWPLLAVALVFGPWGVAATVALAEVGFGVIALVRHRQAPGGHRG